MNFICEIDDFPSVQVDHNKKIRAIAIRGFALAESKKNKRRQVSRNYAI